MKSRFDISEYSTIPLKWDSTSGTSYFITYGSGFLWQVCLSAISLIVSHGRIQLYNKCSPFWGIIPFMILTIINVKIFYAMKTLKDRLKGKSYRYVWYLSDLFKHFSEILFNRRDRHEVNKQQRAERNNAAGE